MIDFQKSGLERQVYEVITRMCDLVKTDEFPKFKTKKQKSGRWDCTLTIPGIETAVAKEQETEVAAINRCASNMLHILNSLDKRGLYDPNYEESVFKDDIEFFFGDLEYDPNYHYYLSTCDINLTAKDEGMKNMIKSYSTKYFDKCIEHGEEIDKICDIVTVRYLVKH